MRMSRITDDMFARIPVLLLEGMTKDEIAAMYGVARNTLTVMCSQRGISLRKGGSLPKRTKLPKRTNLTRAIDHTPAVVFEERKARQAVVFEERKARQAVEYRDLTSEFFGDPRPGYSQLDRRGRA
jgi:transposase